MFHRRLSNSIPKRLPTSRRLDSTVILLPLLLKYLLASLVYSCSITLNPYVEHQLTYIHIIPQIC
nr:MAG TPA: hypothetical protein [Caudoviricetes sp.]